MSVKALLRGARKLVSRQAPLAKGVKISSSAVVTRDSEIGAYSFIGHGAAITRATLGRYVSIANNVSIGMGEHELDRVSTSSVFYACTYDELTKAPCVIGPDVWIGVDAIVRRGVTIGLGAVIGANSFVNRDVPDFAIAVGSPARVIGHRFTPAQQDVIRASRWWEHERAEAEALIAQLEAGFAQESQG